MKGYGVVVVGAGPAGFSARRSDGRPGWLSICRGWLQLTWMVEGFTLARGGLGCGQRQALKGRVGSAGP